MQKDRIDGEHGGTWVRSELVRNAYRLRLTMMSAHLI